MRSKNIFPDEAVAYDIGNNLVPPAKPGLVSSAQLPRCTCFRIVVVIVAELISFVYRAAAASHIALLAFHFTLFPSSSAFVSLCHAVARVSVPVPVAHSPTRPFAHLSICWGIAHSYMHSFICTCIHTSAIAVCILYVPGSAHPLFNWLQLAVNFLFLTFSLSFPKQAHTQKYKIHNEC